MVPIPFSVTPSKIESNLQCGMSDQLVLTDEEMAEIATIDKNCRLIKRSSFLMGRGIGVGSIVGPRRYHSEMRVPSAYIMVIKHILVFKSR